MRQRNTLAPPRNITVRHPRIVMVEATPLAAEALIAAAAALMVVADTLQAVVITVEGHDLPSAVLAHLTGLERLFLLFFAEAVGFFHLLRSCARSC
jgi:hypothetical protein